MSFLPPVIILCGGKATRLGLLALNTPKAMIPFQGLPFIGHQLHALRSQEIGRVMLCVGHLGDQIQDYVGFGVAFDMLVTYSWDDGFGTGGALRKALLTMTDDDVFVLYGDSYITCNFRDVYSRFAEYQNAAALMTTFKKLPDAIDTPNVFLKNSFAHYNKENPSPKADSVDYGLSIINRERFLLSTGDSPFDLGEYFALISNCGRLAGMEMKDPYYEIGSIAGMGRFKDMLKNRRRA